MAAPQVVTLRTQEPAYLLYLLPAWFFAAFLTKVRFVPVLRHNVGPFESMGILAMVLFVLVESRRTPIRGHRLIRLTLAIFLFAVVSQLWLPSTHTLQGLTQVSILFFLLLFLTLSYALSMRYRIAPERLLTIVTVAILIVGPWVLIHGFSGDVLSSAGPFRNRAHMAVYLLTGFWLVLIHAMWPHIKKWKRFASYACLILTLYAIASSGRRSVYLSLFVGLVGLGVAFLAAHRGKRVHMLFTGAFTIGFLVLLYVNADNLTPQTAFFKERISQVDDRVREAVSSKDKLRSQKGFLALQREGVMMAFRTSPVVGIGWGGFAKSRFSPTGHEVHSMPMRFLAELGIVGLGLYLLFMGTLLMGTARLFLRMRRTPYGGSYLALMLGLWSMTISYAYNRHLTERTFWILIGVYLSMEIFATDYERIQKLVFERHDGERLGAQAHPSPAGLQPATARAGLTEPGPTSLSPSEPRGPRLLPGIRPETTS